MIKRIKPGKYQTEDSKYLIVKEWFNDLFYWNVYKDNLIVRNCETLTEAKEFVKNYIVKGGD